MLEIATNILGYTTKKTAMPGEIATPIDRLDPKIQGCIGAVFQHLKWIPKNNKHDRWWEPGPSAWT